jgi:hypothetical protein
MLRKFIPILLIASAPLASCASLGSTTVVLSADKAQLVAITAFVEAKRVALAGIQSGVITGDTKAKVISLANKGQAIEDRIYATRSSADIIALTDVVAQLTTLTGSK